MTSGLAGKLIIQCASIASTAVQMFDIRLERHIHNDSSRWLMVILFPRNKVVHKEVYIDALRATEMPFHSTGFRYDCVCMCSICVIKNKHY